MEQKWRQIHWPGNKVEQKGDSPGGWDNDDERQEKETGCRRERVNVIL